MILTSPTELNSIPKRIISLVPSQTELLHHLGLEEETIAITKFCVHPEIWFKTKTRIGGTKALNIEKIMELQPDLIIANNEENVKDQVEALAEKFPVWVTDVCDLASAIKMIGDIGLLTGKVAEAGNLESGIGREFARLQEFIVEQEKPAIRTAYFIWKDPYMTIGGDTFINDMMKRSGLQNIFESTKRYPEITVQQLKERLDKGENIHLVDVREPNENSEFNIGGKLLPLGDIRNMQTESIDDWKKDEVVLYCRSGNRSGIAAQILDQMGFENTKNLTGGMLAWKDNFGENK